MESHLCWGTSRLYSRPLLFLLNINDIVVDIRSSIRLFADDTSLYIIVDNPDHAAQLLNADLEKLPNGQKLGLLNVTPVKQNPFLSHVKQVGLHILQFLCLIKK